MLAINQAGGGPVEGVPGTSQQIQQELQLDGRAWDDRLSFVAGAFGFWEDATRGNTVYAPGVPNATESEISVDNWTWALFGQTTAEVTDWLSLTAGLRYSEDKKGARQINRNVLLPPETPPTRDGSGRQVFNAWTPMGSIAVSAPEDLLDGTELDHLMGYFTYARGFKGGGFNAVIDPSAEGNQLEPFGPETLDSFEIGIKSVAFEQRLTVNLAIFQSAYADIQQTVTDATELPDGTISVRRLTLNAAEAMIRGFEAELQVVPLEGLRISGTLGYMDARFDSFPGAIDSITGEVIDRAGQTLNNSPSLQTFIAVQYAVPVNFPVQPWLRGWLTPRLEWAYRSRFHVSGPETWALEQSGYNLLNARLSYDFLDDRASVALWGRNLINQLHFDTGLDLGRTFGSVRRAWEAPRTFGGELSYAF
ncbi:MAG: TonB-dependent receptor [Deltaproteobacteria bacterium]